MFVFLKNITEIHIYHNAYLCYNQIRKYKTENEYDKEQF